MGEVLECSGLYMRMWGVSLVVYKAIRDLAKYAGCVNVCEEIVDGNNHVE